MPPRVTIRLTGLMLCLVLAAVGCGGGASDPVTDDVADAATAPDGAAAPSPAGEGEEEKTEAALTLPEDPAEEQPAEEQPAEEQPAEAEPAGDDADAGQPVDGPPPPPTEGLPGGRYVQLTDISLDGDAYAAAFTPYNFTPLIGDGPDDYHVHFFFDTVAPENAGTNGPAPGDWFLYDGPSPFTGYTTADRPEGATQLCALVADRAHAVTLETGNCLPLP